MKKKHALSASRDPNNEFEYTPEEEEAWKVLESKMPRATQEDLERLEREAKKPKNKQYPAISVLGENQND
jgi:hypothetical protein